MHLSHTAHGLYVKDQELWGDAPVLIMSDIRLNMSLHAHVAKLKETPVFSKRCSLQHRGTWHSRQDSQDIACTMILGVALHLMPCHV